jgi:hypothetical protein
VIPFYFFVDLFPLFPLFQATLTGVTITASKAFTVITLFNILRFPFAFLPLAIVQWITTAIALGRVQNFLLLEEIDTDVTRGGK